MNSVIEGEVLTPAVLPPDVNTKVGALQHLDGESQALAVTVMLSHSRTGLLAAIAAQDLPGIVEFKAKASAIQEITKQLRLGKDMQLDAAEFVRRAERGLGVAIREGQANGTVETRSEAASRGAIERDIRLGRSTKSSEDIVRRPGPRDFATETELNGVTSRNTGVNRPGIYAFTDNVSDDQFEEALAEARDENNLSRANVARKAKAKANPIVDPAREEIAPGMTAADLDELNAPKPKRKGKRFDSDRIIRETSIALEGLVMGVSLTDLTAINRSELDPFINSIHDSLRILNKFSKGLRNA